MNITVIDFESYFDRNYSLTKLTIPEYVADARFHAHGLAVRRPDGKSEFLPDVAAALNKLQQEFGQDLERTIVACHNARFDLYILNYRYRLRPKFFIDTMLLAQHVHGRREGFEGDGMSLGALAERYQLPQKGNLEFLWGVRNPTVQQMADLASYARRDVEITGDLAELLLPQITRPEVELPILMHSVRAFTERSVKINVAGIAAIKAIIKESTAKLVEMTGFTPEQLAKNQDFAAMLATALERTGRKLPLKLGKNGLIPALAKTDPEMQELLDDDDPVVAALVAARLEKTGENQKLARLATLERIAQDSNGALPIYLDYFGSHTGRFAGGGKFNIQNLGRSGLGGKIRELLVARPGHALVIGDLAQIEARITAWLAGQRDVLRAFSESRDQYSEFAAATLHCEVRKPKRDDPPDIRAQMESRRQVGKTAVLGLGFGMGALKFMNRLRADPAATSLFATGDLTPLVCRQIVKDYRLRYESIPAFWEAVEKAARAAVDGVVTEVGPLKFDRTDDTIRIWLPSGRALRYSNMRLEGAQRPIHYLNDDGEEDEFTPDGPVLVYGKGTNLYGGKLCENIVQATARDLLVEAVLRLEKRGFIVLFHVHDEIVIEVHDAEKAEAAKAVEDEMGRVPEWASGLPIGCEIKVQNHYGK